MQSKKTLFDKGLVSIAWCQLGNTSYFESVVLLSKIKLNKLKHVNVKLEMGELD